MADVEDHKSDCGSDCDTLPKPQKTCNCEVDFIEYKDRADCECCDSKNEELFWFNSDHICKMCVLKRIGVMPLDIEDPNRQGHYGGYYGNDDSSISECCAPGCYKDDGDLAGTSCKLCKRWFCGYHDMAFILLGYCSSCRSERS
jgi:hypothetical protein